MPVSPGMLQCRITCDGGLADHDMRRELEGGYELDDEPGRVDIGVVHAYLSEESYWAKGRSLDDVLSVAGLNADPVLAALLSEASVGDQLAGRVVLQALIGRIVRMAQRDPRANIDDYLAHLWCVIGSYPLKRRPVRIAANLSMDTLKAVSRDRRWLERGDITLWP